MSDLSFAVAHKTTLSTNTTTYRKIDTAFDDKAKFNRIIARRENKPESLVNSISPNHILRRLVEDDLNSLLQITLKCCYVRGDYGMWDVLFNVINREGLTSCIFLANKDYQPIAKERVEIASQFLNLTLPTSRIHLNKVNVEDKIGIGIYDTRSQLTYVLLYTVMGYTTISDTSNGNEDRPQIIPSINCQLDQIYRVDHLGEADVIDVGEQNDNVTATPFVEWMVNSTADITAAYPWKPHFLPTASRGYDREKVEADIQVELERVQLGRYEDFEEESRVVYNLLRDKRQESIQKNRVRRDGQNQPDRKKKNDVKFSPPICSIIDQGDFITAIIPARTPDDQNMVYQFNKSTLGNASVVEKYLLGHDLDRDNLVEASGIYLLSEDKFGKDAFLRQLTINF